VAGVLVGWIFDLLIDVLMVGVLTLLRIFVSSEEKVMKVSQFFAIRGFYIPLDDLGLLQQKIVDH
jgi:hypothetical protein